MNAEFGIKEGSEIMRIPLTSLVIASEGQIRAAADVLARERAEGYAATLVRRWSRNPRCLRAAMAAHAGVDPKFVLESSPSLTNPMIRAVEAFADEMARQRGEPT